MLALEDDEHPGFDAFDRALWAHVGHAIANTFRAWGRSWSGGLFAPAPNAGEGHPLLPRQLSRYAPPLLPWPST